MIGQTFARLTVVEKCPHGVGRTLWLCRCICGNERRLDAYSLRSGNTKSCGCLSRERSAENFSARERHGMRSSPEYSSWRAMRKRCSCPNDPCFHAYGGRGITVCERWQKFENFFADMGPRPSAEHSIERDDTNGNYEPNNCRWATPVEQGNNRRNNHRITHDGRTQTIAEWAREVGISRSVLRGRIHRGWTVDRALGGDADAE